MNAHTHSASVFSPVETLKLLSGLWVCVPPSVFIHLSRQFLYHMGGLGSASVFCFFSVGGGAEDQMSSDTT